MVPHKQFEVVIEPAPVGRVGGGKEVSQGRVGGREEGL